MVDGFLEKAKDFKLANLKGLIAPHAGYIYSGQTAGVSYRQLQSLPDKKYKVFLLGPSHHVHISASVGNFEAYETPLGKVKVDQKICQQLLENSKLDFIEEAHLPEHCLEVQLPFLQRTLKNFEIVPILCGSINPEKLATVLTPYFDQSDSLFVISSDLSHYLPATEAEQKDKASLDIITNLDIKNEIKIDACGATPIQAVMRLAKANNYRIKLLDYRHSGQTAGDNSAVVGYASLVITKKI